MNLYTVISLVITIKHLLVFDVIAQSEQPNLNFFENLYAKMSGACRAIVDLQFNSMNSQNGILKTMKIIYIDKTEKRTFSIDKAFQTLTQPDVFDITKQTKIIIHGFRDSSQSSVTQDIAEGYNEKNMFNVLLVDAEEMMNQRYILSVHNARLIGKRLANLLGNLENFGASADDFHLIGVSLGAHIAGWAGKYFHKYKSHLIGRITGLDPAGPCFSFAYPDQRLDKMDAKYVDVMHSNMLMQGVIEPLGHADFYINGGGPQQPGCVMPSCSHLRAAQVYAESIRTPKSFVGIRCQSWQKFEANKCKDSDYAVLGYGSSTSTRGLYYLRTSAGSPFGLGMNGTKYITPKDNNNWLMDLSYT
ncbi:lipase member I-like [Vanessa tameamea]|uniref:Lipase member I-like n=1 Tax=Vanessa tameamea TaxID=334116 RepID=A0A8B8IQ73_VANTA|nr:lipase member I-like [Vanessa tameamea]